MGQFSNRGYELKRANLRKLQVRYWDTFPTLAYSTRIREHEKGVKSLLRKIRRDIERSGHRVIGVAPESYMRPKILSAVAREPDKRLEIAEYFGLSMVDGKIKIPDFQLLVQQKAGGTCVVNADFASKHYRKSQILSKNRASIVVGHRGAREEMIYAKRVKDGPNLLGRIASL